MAVVAAGCGSDGGSPTADATTVVASTAEAGGTTAPTTPAGLGEGFAPERDGRSPLAGFGEAAATVTAPDGTTCEVCLLLAATEAQRERGLMEVTDPELGGYDGMLFRFPDPKDGGFWMRNTPMPLSIAYADASGTVFQVEDMVPCSDDPSCPSYPAEQAFGLVLEVPQGRLDDLAVEEGSTIVITAERCPLASAGSTATTTTATG